MNLDDAREIAEHALDQLVRPGVGEDVVITALYEYPNNGLPTTTQVRIGSLE